MLALLALDEGGSFTVGPSLGLVLYTVVLALLVAALVHRVVRFSRSRPGRR